MSSDYLPDLPQGFDPALLSAPGTPPCTDVDYEFQALNSFYASCAFEENGNLQAHLSSLETIDPALLSHPTSPVPLSQPNSPGSISSHRPDTTRAQPAIDPYELFPWHPSSGNHAALAVQSACPSPVLPSFDLSPQQARATSQPPEDHQPFRDVDDNLAPPHTPSMSFHRIVQPRGKRSHAYHPYSRRHESAPKRKRPIKPSAPTSALKLVSLGDNALAERIKLNGSSPEDPSYHVAYPRGDRNEQVDQDWAFEMATASPHSLISGCNYSQNSLPQLGGPVHSNAKANADSVKSIPPDAKDVTKDLRYLPETSLSLKLASHVQTLAQLCIEIQTSLQGAISPDWANGDISYRIKIEQERLGARAKNGALTKLHEAFATLPRPSSSSPDATSSSHEVVVRNQEEVQQDGVAGVVMINRDGSSCDKATTHTLPRNGLDVRRLDHARIHRLLDLYGLPYSPDQFLYEKKLLYMRFLGLGQALMHRVLD